MNAAVSDCLWPLERLGEALTALARRTGALAGHAADSPAPVSGEQEQLEAWLSSASGALGLELDPVQLRCEELPGWLDRSGPAILVCADQRALVLLGGGRALTPEGKIHRLAADRLRETLLEPIAAPVRARIDALIERAQIRPRAQAAAREALIAQELSSATLGHAWLVRPAVGSGPPLARAGLAGPLVGYALLYLAQYLSWVGSWWVLGNAAFEAHVDAGLLSAWALLLAALLPLRWGATWLQGVVALRAWAALKERLLVGALAQVPEALRQSGIGQQMGRVLESSAVERFAVSGSLSSLAAGLELSVALLIALLVPHGRWAALSLTGWVLGVAGLALIAGRAYRRWATTRLSLSEDLVEQMIGHRTRLAQQPPARWNVDEDRALEGYVTLSREVDDRIGWLKVLAPRGWLVLGLGLVGFALLAGASRGEEAALLGSVLLAYQAFSRLADGFLDLTAGWVALRQLMPLLAAMPQSVGVPWLSATSAAPGKDRPILEAEGLVFRYPGREASTLERCTLKLKPGDRVLLEGSSGSGKSTLASILTGLRSPSSGVLLLEGLDRHSVGAEAWRRRVIAAPQFHENHVLSETLAFNLLMGCGWPPDENDLARAEELCRALDLGPVIERMPSGLLQAVGETGWQLSHGERSRVFLARALLQNPSVLILDESFAALDPKTFLDCLSVVRERARALLVIAHP